MKFEANIKDTKLQLSWENVGADFYKIYLKVDGEFFDCATVDDTFTTISMIPYGDNECYISAVRNGVVIDKSPIFYFNFDKIDGVCFKSGEKTSVICSKYSNADGYRLYKSSNGEAFNGIQNSNKNGLDDEFEDDCEYKLKPYRIENGQREILSSTDVLSLKDNKFKKVTIYKSYGQKCFISWIYEGYADGFLVYQQGSDYPIFETNDGLSHCWYLKNYIVDTKFCVKAFLNTPNGKVIISESEYTNLRNRKFEKAEVSIIIPAYNSENYISRSIDSALASDFENLEIVIVNDGSTDSTQEIIDWYSTNYPNIVSIQKENGGVADTRNVGISAAEGDYIGFLDNDDMIRPNMISTLYESIVKNKCDIAIAPLYRLVDKGYTVHCKLPFEEDKAINIDKYFEILYTPGYYNCAIWNKLYNAQMVKSHPLGILKYEDVSWTPCILSYAKNFCFIKTPFYEWDRKTRPETFGDVLAKMPEDELLEHRRQAMMFFVENGNPQRKETLKTIAKRRLMRYNKNANHDGYLRLIESL